MVVGEVVSGSRTTATHSPTARASSAAQGTWPTCPPPLPFFYGVCILVVNIWWKCDRLVFEIWKDGSKSIAMCAWILINGVFGGGNAITCWLVASSFFFYSRDWIDGTEPSITCWFNWWYRITTCRLIALFMAGLMMQDHVVLLGWW